MKNSVKILTVALLIYVALSMLQSDVRAAEGTGSGSSCTVTVMTTKEDGSVDSSVTPFQAPCRHGESNGGYEYYNPYNDTYTYKSEAQMFSIEPLKSTKKSSSRSTTGTSTRTGSSGSSSQTGSSTSNCTSSGSNTTKIKKATRSLSSGRPCTSTPR